MKRVFFAVLSVLFFVAGTSHGFSLKEVPRSILEDRQPDPPTGMVPAMGFDESNGSVSAPSVSRAVLYSLLCPGLGQYYLGERSTAWKFFLAEGAVWTSFVVFQVQGRLRRDAYKDYALVFAGISTRDHSDDFYREIGDYDSSYDYEIALKSEGRARTYPYSDYATLERYFIENRMSDYEPWQWRSRSDREHYYSLRWGSRLAFRRSLYSLAAALGNRVVSAVFALRSARAARAGGWNTGVGFYSSTEPSGYATLGIGIRRDF